MYGVDASIGVGLGVRLNQSQLAMFLNLIRASCFVHFAVNRAKVNLLAQLACVKSAQRQVTRFAVTHRKIAQVIGRIAAGIAWCNPTAAYPTHRVSVFVPNNAAAHSY